MLMMSCHLALNSKGAMSRSRDAISESADGWRCTSCGCRLVLHPGDDDTPPWFEHDQTSADASALAYCQYRQHRDGLPGERFRVMLYSVHGQDIRMATESWYCVWCGCHYEGEKHCAVCNTGIYSIEDTVGQGDIHPIEDPAQCPPADLGGY
ncbi:MULTISPECIES: zinc-ribbon domain-containing protein [Pseudocitrobacter]|uniref:Uncharacterized protein n=1 Tax=Pseudocitrobacter vendiensis TaxID=2488306 RepID=A0ABN8T7B7_9ENTR|nr:MULTISPECIES: zinc-ribbon domain-containing protein [Pseudocitrobacter]MDF3826874.1 zinc-ribbon domain-containing protein [Pseudocitrobacter sp. 2023EL-00150]MEC5372463.1 zinc-ribbon domain-containing protein [Pseudocitrobacter sp. MW920760]CAH6636234.1 hypothetical protein FBBNIHIM_05320 [Pseudocitrobacter vendiensis]